MAKDTNLIVRMDKGFKKSLESKAKKEFKTSISDINRILLSAWLNGEIVIKVEQKKKVSLKRKGG